MLVMHFWGSARTSLLLIKLSNDMVTPTAPNLLFKKKKLQHSLRGSELAQDHIGMNKIPPGILPSTTKAAGKFTSH